ncbi:uroporphyrinogen-III synthase [Histidinibacterium lentulum]|uniref:Uroporphyrinogen-III synthase n=1 Tax=Histidinibacterium lentulum TaxID=2480588 RepID=A0A3N2R704_9RHOB|nr:uroporphyrinogen-III synthase [Histidinibacterium lentulum]ROU03197.1 uroporphyrinogen-III synthase [Histidinibacterium lentulum]
MTPILLVTRPLPEAERFVRTVMARLARRPQVILSPLMDIVTLGVETPPDVAGLVLTSARGAEAAGRLGLPRGLSAWCVGAQTEAAAEAAGLVALPGGGDADALVSRVLAARPKGPLLHLRGAHARGDVAARLSAGGVETIERVVYDQRARPPSDEALAALRGTAPVIAPVFSPRSAALLAEAGPVRAPLAVAAISPAAAEAAAPLGAARIGVADRPDGSAMAVLTCRLLEETPQAHPSA